MSQPPTSHFGISNIFEEFSGQINSMDLSRANDILVTSSDGDDINVFDCESCTKLGSLPSGRQKHGTGHIRFTQNPNTVIHSSGSKTIDNDIRFLDLLRNECTLRLSGHRGKILSLSTSPVGDTFLSSSMDGTVRLWDARLGHHNAQVAQLLRANSACSRPIAAFDPLQGLFFAVAQDSRIVHFYDIRRCAPGGTAAVIATPFRTFHIPPEQVQSNVTGLDFSPNGLAMVASSDGDRITLFSIESRRAFSLANFNGCGMAIQATFTPDSQYVVSGSTNGSLHFWRVLDRKREATVEGDCSLPIQCVRYNPKHATLVTACKNVAFWKIAGPRDKPFIANKVSSVSCVTLTTDIYHFF